MAPIRYGRPVLLWLPFILCFLLARISLAQQRADPVAIGMGRASVATARGLSSIQSNYGSLGLDALGARDSMPGSVELDLAIVPFGASAGSTYLSASDLEFVFASKNREDFSDADRVRLADLIEEGRLSADAAVDFFSMRLKIPGVMGIGLRYGHRVRAQMIFPENFRTEVLGNGDIYRGGETFTNPEIGGEWTRSIGLVASSAWSRPNIPNVGDAWLPAFGVGFDLEYVEGIVHFDVDPESIARTRRLAGPATETWRQIEVTGAYRFRSSEPYDTSFNPSDAILNPGFIDGSNAAAVGWQGGVGLSIVILRRSPLDFGAVTGSPLRAEEFSGGTINSRDALLFGIQLEGVGTLTWNGRNLRRSYPNIRDTLSESDGAISNDIIYRYEAPLDTIGAFTTQFPAQLRVGLGADITAFVPSIPGDLIASVEGAFDLNSAIGHERTRFSLGGEWWPTRTVGIRSGVQIGGRVGLALAFGLGLRPLPWLSVDIATSELTSLFFADRRRVDLALRGSLAVEF